MYYEQGAYQCENHLWLDYIDDWLSEGTLLTNLIVNSSNILKTKDNIISQLMIDPIFDQF